MTEQETDRTPQQVYVVVHETWAPDDGTSTIVGPVFDSEDAAAEYVEHEAGTGEQWDVREFEVHASFDAEEWFDD